METTFHHCRVNGILRVSKSICGMDCALFVIRGCTLDCGWTAAGLRLDCGWTAAGLRMDCGGPRLIISDLMPWIPKNWFKLILFRYRVHRKGLGAAKSAILPSPEGGKDIHKERKHKYE